MRAYKFLGYGGVGRFSDFAWPLPSRDAPGSWVEAGGPLAECVKGVHACRARDLPEWIDDELWEVELDGTIDERDVMVVGERGRLVRRVEEWSSALASEFAESCAWRTREFALRALRREGQHDQADSLAAAEDLPDMQARAVVSAVGGTGVAATAAAFAADAVALARGRRPETWELGVPAAGPLPEQSAGATAANLAFVVAHTAGLDAVAENGDQAAYASGFAAERAWQVHWLTERLRLA